ncbi:MAG: MFS transporter [Planctomycetota bacterium]
MGAVGGRIAVQREPRSTGAFTSLSIMMFLQYAVWGIWLPYLANYLQAPIDDGGLGFSGGQVGWILGLAASVGAVSAPFLAGQIADRFINAERYLGLLVIIGGLLKFITAYATDFSPFLILSVAYSVVYMPTLALTNSIAFAHLRRPEATFPLVRVWGTIGWIVASNAFPLIWLQSNLEFTSLPPFLAGTEHADATARIVDCLKVSGVMSVAYGIYAITLLPKTPPKPNSDAPAAFLKAFGMLRHRGFLVLTLASLPISMIHTVYFIRTGPFLESIGFTKAHVGPVMSVGQISEIVFLAILGVLISRLGFLGTLVLGCAAYLGRFAIFAIATEDLQGAVIAANALHGLCYGCFYAAAYIFVERISPADIRHSAQTVFAVIILGVGPILAGFFNAHFDRYTITVGDQSLQSYSELWWTQAIIALAVGTFLLLFFRSNLPDDDVGADPDDMDAKAAAMQE